MAGGVVGWDGRARQDELARATAASVDLAADVVPDGRHELPLVDQPGPGAVEEQRRREEPCRTCLVVDVETNCAHGRPQAGRGLAAAARSLDQDGADRRETSLELGVGHPRAVLDDRGAGIAIQDTHMVRSYAPICVTPRHPDAGGAESWWWWPCWSRRTFLPTRRHRDHGGRLPDRAALRVTLELAAQRAGERLGHRSAAVPDSRHPGVPASPARP